jgi:hypothetical protein
MSIANMLENGCTAVSAYCEGPGCQHEVSISVVELYRMGFKPEDTVIDIGWKLKCSRCWPQGRGHPAGLEHEAVAVRRDRSVKGRARAPHGAALERSRPCTRGSALVVYVPLRIGMRRRAPRTCNAPLILVSASPGCARRQIRAWSISAAAASMRSGRDVPGIFPIGNQSDMVA